MLERAALSAALERVSEGDRSALHEVYRRTSAKLFGTILRILGDAQEAEDVLQEAYIGIWQKAGSFDPDRASQITWLVTIARNRAIDRLRKTGRQRMMPIEAASEVADERPDAEATVIAADYNSRIHQCIHGLDGNDAALVRTAFFHGSTYAELAERSATPLGTIKSRIRRALVKLRECLQ